MEAPLPRLPSPPHASTPPPIPLHTSTSAHSLANTPQLPPPRRSPGVSKKALSLSLDITLSSAPLSQSPHSSPTPRRKGYAELQFENGSLNTSKVSPIPERRHQPDVPNKFNYSKLQFEEEKKELESGEVSKKAKKPTPPPKYQGNMMKNMTESNLQAENRVSSSKGRSKPTSLPDIKAGQQHLDYAEVVFTNKTAVSPSASRCILGPPICSDDSPPGNQVTPTSIGTVEYATVILKPKVEVRNNNKDKPRPDGYENFDFKPILQKEKDSGYANFDFSPNPSMGRDSSNLTQGPTVAGSARLVRPDHPQPKPR